MRRNTRTDQRGALVHNQNCVVYHDPDHHYTAEEPHHGHRHAGCPERRIHAEEAERHREHDQEGTGPGLHDCGDQKVGQDCRQKNDLHEFARRFIHQFHVSAHPYPVAGGQGVLRHFADCA